MSEKSDKQPVTIETRTDGPFLVKHLMVLKDATGTSIETKAVMALCRCGGSANKPFCDGTHKANGYSGTRETTKPIDKKRAYEGTSVTIFDNRTICCHAAHCVEELPSVFRRNEKTWVEPNGAGNDEIADLVNRCPSGALSYVLKGAEPKAKTKEPEIQIIADGPYHVTGPVSLEGEQVLPPPDPDRYALCRCGASRNKPFCDGSHVESGFRG